MSEAFFEIYSEEIPSRMQKHAEEQLKCLLEKFLDELHITYDAVKTFVTPQRLIGYIDSIALKSQKKVEYIRGPKKEASQEIIEKFKAAHQSHVIIKDNYLFAEKIHPPVLTKTMFPDMIQSILQAFSWPKSMRYPWGATWVRPIQQIFMMVDGQILSKSAKTVFGHRFMAPQPFVPKDFADYVTTLESRCVIIDRHQRIKKITQELPKDAIVDDDLLDENAGLCEYPIVFKGKIDKKFMQLPFEILATSMKTHQKYFPFKQGKPYFAVVANINSQHMMYGYERVLRARLSDAEFFFHLDQKKPLTDLVEKLGSVQFHKELGTMLDKTKRLQTLMPDALGKRAALLCKADLLTHMVGEFPELQGVMGRIYARMQGEEEEVASAIYEHYLPLGAQSAAPQTKTGIYLALFDKIDTLVGLIGGNVAKASGSKDPFGLRRAALGIIRIYVETGIKDNLETLIDASINAYGINITHKPQVEEFIKARLVVFLKEKGFDENVIHACLMLDMASMLERMAHLSGFLRLKAGQQFLESYKRVLGILKPVTPFAVNVSDFTHETERLLADSLKSAKPFNLDRLAELSMPLRLYFDQVMILKGDPHVIDRRLNLLAQFSRKVEEYIRFSKVL